jgi:uncharacterized repeat protein (TIGR04076 family)
LFREEPFQVLSALLKCDNSFLFANASIAESKLVQFLHYLQKNTWEGFKMQENVLVKVKESQCKFYKPGDQILINGPLLNKEESGNICITALLSFYPFIFAMRKGVTAAQLGFAGPVEVQCPDYCAPVVFILQKV